MSFPSSDPLIPSRISSCLSAISAWMHSHHLKLNLSKFFPHSSESPSILCSPTPFLTDYSTQLLVQSLVLSRLDYCNALLAGLTATTIEDNGLPVHIKGGTVDVLLYRFTMGITLGGRVT
ncbi:CX7A2 oxidase, partial [Amia calva]|nr:CX7A2 oxidase [Amia calva]